MTRLGHGVLHSCSVSYPPFYFIGAALINSRHIGSILLICASLAVVQAQPQYRFERLSLEEGVANNLAFLSSLRRGLAEETPEAARLDQNYPNPFNPVTVVPYQLSMRSGVSLSILNVLGQEVALLFEGVQEAGMHRVVWDGKKVPSGVYFCRLTVVNVSEPLTNVVKVMRKMSLVR